MNNEHDSENQLSGLLQILHGSPAISELIEKINLFLQTKTMADQTLWYVHENSLMYSARPDWDQSMVRSFFQSFFEVITPPHLSEIKRVIRQINTNQLVTSFLERFKFDSLVCVPLISHSETIGLIVLCNIPNVSETWECEQTTALLLQCACNAIVKQQQATLIKSLESQLHCFQSESQQLADLLTQRNQQVEWLSQSLRIKNEELENVVYGISHDLRTPVISTGGLLTMLLDEYGTQLDLELKQYLQRFQTNMHHLSLLLGDFMDYFRISTVRETIITCSSSLLVERILKELEKEILLRTITVRMVGNFPEITCERSRIYIVFKHLIENAIKHMGNPPNAAIEIRAKTRDADFYFEIWNNGIPIPREYHRKVFRIFNKLSAQSKTSGTGMGLAIAQKIIEFHGGKIGLCSEPDSGTLFWFSLPRETSVVQANLDRFSISPKPPAAPGSSCEEPM